MPRLIKRIKAVISGGFKSEYNIGGVPDPFLQVETLKLLRLLSSKDSESSDQLGDLLAFVGAEGPGDADRDEDGQLVYRGERGAVRDGEDDPAPGDRERSARAGREHPREVPAAQRQQHPLRGAVDAAEGGWRAGLSRRWRSWITPRWRGTAAPSWAA